MSTSIVWFWNIRCQSLVHSVCRIGWSEILRDRCLSGFIYRLDISFGWLSRHKSLLCQRPTLSERDILPISSFKERSLPSSFLFEEMIFLPLSLSRRGEPLSVSRPELHSNVLTALFSSLMAHSVSVETTEIISLWNEVMISSKSFGIMIISKLVDEFVLKLDSVMDVFMLEIFNFSSNDLSNCFKFASLSLAYDCINVFVIWLAYRTCMSMHIIIYSFMLEWSN